MTIPIVNKHQLALIGKTLIRVTPVDNSWSNNEQFF